MPAGSEKLILEFFQDITEQKCLQDDLIQSEKLAGIGTLATGIAHEINNPLSGIIGTAELLLEGVDKDDHKYEYITDIIKYSLNAADIIKDLNNYSRKKREKQEPVNIEEILETALLLIKRGMSLDGINIRKQYEELPPIEANSNELQQVFVNVIMNSVQVMSGGGGLTLTCERERGNVHIAVEDTGPGIDKNNIEKLFNPFFTTKEPGMGTGLGLSISHQLIHRMGGRITVSSTLGIGTTFHIYIPLNEKERNRIRFVHAHTEKMKEDVFYLQRKILVGEKGYTEETIHRDFDENAFHMLAYKGLQPVGTVSCHSEDFTGDLPIELHFPLRNFKKSKPTIEIDRLAVLKNERASIIPLGLMTLAYLYAKSNNSEVVFLDVFSDEKKHVAMYKKLGFKAIGQYNDPLPVTVMMLEHETDYEKKNNQMEQFVKPFMHRLTNYFDFTQTDRSIFIETIEKLTEKPAQQNV